MYMKFNMAVTYVEYEATQRLLKQIGSIPEFKQLKLSFSADSLFTRLRAKFGLVDKMSVLVEVDVEPTYFIEIADTAGEIIHALKNVAPMFSTFQRLAEKNKLYVVDKYFEVDGKVVTDELKDYTNNK